APKNTKLGFQDSVFPPPIDKITDQMELDEYRLRKRKQFEDLIRRDRRNISVWVKYAEYAEFEMKNNFIDHASSVWECAVTLLPQVDKLWFKYVHMEEMDGNVTRTRGVFERWMEWMPW
ncbi:crooked neck 1-like protein, partial [Trifolium pratense]